MSKKKRGGGDKEYILSYIIQQKWINELINFYHSNTKAILIRNLPMEENMPLSPITNGYLDPSQYPFARDLILTIYKTMNIIPYSYEDENKGKLFRSIVPVKKESDMVGSYGSRYEFKFHCDNPTFKIYPEYMNETLNAPEFLSLFCIRGQEDVYTKIMILDDILNQLSKDTVKTLEESIFIINTPDSFDKYHEVHNVSAIEKYKNKFYTRFDYHNIKGTNTESILALKTFIEIMNKTKPVSLSFKSGDFLIFKNQEVLHSRDAFQAKNCGEDRWLLRLYGANNIAYLNHNKINKKEFVCI